MGTQGLGVLLEARIVHGDVAGAAAIDAGIAELGDDKLLDARTACFERFLFGCGLGQRLCLVEVGGLVVLPLVEELIVEDDAVDNEDDEARNRKCQSHRSGSHFHGEMNSQLGPRK